MNTEKCLELAKIMSKNIRDTYARFEMNPWHQNYIKYYEVPFKGAEIKIIDTPLEGINYLKGKNYGWISAKTLNKSIGGVILVNNGTRKYYWRERVNSVKRKYDNLYDEKFTMRLERAINQSINEFFNKEQLKIRRISSKKGGSKG